MNRQRRSKTGSRNARYLVRIVACHDEGMIKTSTEI